MRLRTAVAFPLVLLGVSTVEASADATCEHAAMPEPDAHVHELPAHDAPQVGEHAHHGGDGRSIRAAVSLGLVLADYDARLYSGHYAGTVIGGSVGRGRFAVAAKLPVYRIVENGRDLVGAGDLVVHLHATVVTRGPAAAGAMLMASAPTGDDAHGLGMGHVMLMPELWASWAPRFASMSASLGYGHAFGGAAAHAEHGGGQWPLVDPMNARELTYAASALAPLTPSLGAGARARGAVPVGDGDHRLAGGGAVVWRAGDLVTTVELLGGLVGDPFGTRGSVETSLSF